MLMQIILLQIGHTVLNLGKGIALNIPGWLIVLGISGIIGKLFLYESLKTLLEGRAIAKSLLSQEICPLPSENLLEAGIRLLFGGTLDLLFIAITVSVLISVLIYFAGKIFDNNNLVAFMKTEILDLLITISLIFFIIMLLTIPCNIYVITEGSIQLNAYDSAFFFTQFTELFFGTVLVISTTIYIISMFFLKTFISNNIFGGLALPAFSGLTLNIKPLLSNLTTAVTLSYTLSAIQVVLYEFLTYGAVKYILPLGVLLRSLAPFKKVGGVIIGFALSGVIFYTAMLNLSWYVAQDYYIIKIESIEDRGDYYQVQSEITLDRQLGQNLEEDIAGIIKSPEQLGVLQDELIKAQMASAETEEAEDGTTIIKYINPATYLADLFGSVLSKIWGTIKALFRGPYQWFAIACGSSAIIGGILPLISFLVVITGTKFFAKFFGEEIDISNLTRVV